MPKALSHIGTWSDFEKLADGLEPKEKGDLFERLTKRYLQLHPTYRTTLSDVWLLSEVPLTVRCELKLPERDQGIDIIARTKAGGYWAVQCKYCSNTDRSLTWNQVSTFAGLAFCVCKNIEFGLIAHTGERHTRILSGAERIGFLSNEVWSSLEGFFFAELASEQDREHPQMVARSPRPHQARAVAKAREYFSNEHTKRGKLIMPCGAGKSLTAFWIAQGLNAQTVVVSVPSLALIQQTLSEWLREYAASEAEAALRWLCVCSDQTVSQADADSVVIHSQDLGFPCLTDSEAIATWLRQTEDASRLVFTTYQSGKVLAEAIRIADIGVDLGILDEAHRTVGDRKRLFSHLLFDEHLPMKRRVFMTATERRFVGDSDDVVSMDDASIYGETVELLTFKQALENDPPILSDYRIVTMIIAQEQVAELVQANRYVWPKDASFDEEVEAQMLAALVALRKAMQKYSITHAVSFHNSIARASAFCDINRACANGQLGRSIDAFHVTGAMPSGLRKRIVAEFARSPRALITNARCLTEGIDVRNIDCVLFADPKRSTVDIVQAVGRALRPAPGKRFGYVLVPVIARATDSENFVDSEAFLPVLTVLRTLASNDERIIDYFRTKHAGRLPHNGIVEFDVDTHLAQEIELEAFTASIDTKAWSRLAPLSWRSYDDAIKFVHALRLQSRSEWQAYCRAERRDLPARPPDIPAGPTKLYGREFFLHGGWGGWLGTGRKSNKFSNFRPYEEAAKFVHGLRLKNMAEWKEYCRGGRPDLAPLPNDIPKSPYEAYRNLFRSGGTRGWLGTARPTYRKCDDAVKFVHELGLATGAEWQAYCDGRRPDLPLKPDDIPRSPDSSYGQEFRDRGGWGAWLGTKGRRRGWHPPGGWRAYAEAVTFVHGLKLKSSQEWGAYCRGERTELPSMPDDIPAAPKQIYGHEFMEKGGWRSWLGARRKGDWRPYSEAAIFVRRLGLKNSAEWRAYYKGERPDLPLKPDDIPSGPYEAYGRQFTESGGMGAWLGTGEIARHAGKKFRPFEEALKFVHELKLANTQEWRAYVRGKRGDLPSRPADVPTSPYAAYGEEFRQKGGWEAWLGK